MKKILILTTALFIGLAGSLNTVQAADQIVKVDGSSTVFPVTEAVAEEFQKSKAGAMRVTVGISGTGGGFKKFCRGETDVSDASRPIKSEERIACKEAGIQFIELPIAYDALTVVVSNKNTWANTLTVADLKKIWEPAANGVITNWNQVRPEFPNQPLKLYGPGTDSGTFDYFTDVIMGKSMASRPDYTASEDDNVLVQGVQNDAGALGYFGFAYYAENTDKLKAVSIDSGSGPIVPSRANVENGTYKPLGRPIFIYVNKKSLDKVEVKEFVNFYLKNAPVLVAQVKYIALPANIYTIVQDRLNRQVVGTSFQTTGAKLEDQLKIEPKI
ncbi:MAG: hypothetical protein ACD_73C00798G0002 [uncultured bacterium]|nr:MAG: hypothetical protein ACD_73C00798G0002 [uncultured bacterium]